MAKIIVEGTEITVIKSNDEDFISLTDMIRAKDGDFFVTDWLRNRNTLEYIEIWEKFYNPAFNYGEFATIQSKAGRYGGTYAHKDVAFEFAMWISPEFKFYMVLELQRLKAKEKKEIAWTAKRELAKINYRIHTDAIKSNLIPAEVTKEQANIIYAEEADVLNVAMFGMTAKQWREANPDSKGNIRDGASINGLICLSNMENVFDKRVQSQACLRFAERRKRRTKFNINAVLINDGVSQGERLVKLNKIAIQQMRVLTDDEGRKLLK